MVPVGSLHREEFAPLKKWKLPLFCPCANPKAAGRRGSGAAPPQLLPLGTEHLQDAQLASLPCRAVGERSEIQACLSREIQAESQGNREGKGGASAQFP